MFFTAGSVSATEDIIEKHLKVMDKIDKKKNDVKAIIAKGEKLESMPKAPVSCLDFNDAEYHLTIEGIPWRETQRDEGTLGKHNNHCKEKARRSEGELVIFKAMER